MNLKNSFNKTSLLFALALVGAGCVSETRDSRDLLEENTFTPGIEGPATDARGIIYAVNYQEEGTIGKVLPDKGSASLFLRLPEGSVGNGIQFDTQGNMYIADYVKHRIYRVPKDGQQVEVWAENGAMNQPNDLCVHPSGALFLSDPNWARDSGKLWRVDPEGNIALLEDGMGTTNGITLSPDSRYLYVNESVQRSVWRYRLDDRGLPAEKTLFIRFEDFGLDGMRCDIMGNLYIARYDKGTLAVVNPKGELLKEYRLKGQKPSNLTFGGAKGKTVYVTMADRGCFETVTALHPGARFKK